VIIWKEAAEAPFVAENGIGLCVSSLKELDGVLSKVTEAGCYEMQSNVMKVRGKVLRGRIHERRFVVCSEDCLK